MQRATRFLLSWLMLPVQLMALAALAGVAKEAPGFLIAFDRSDDRLAVNGYDPVAYFIEGVPTRGDPAHEHSADGAVYRFASAENRRRFVADPQRYMPAFGGFCAYGVRTGRKFPTEPTAWRIVDGRLFLLLNAATKAIWDLEVRDNIEIADTIWPQISPYTDAELIRRAP